MKIFQKIKKGFTIVELVIVIAVIAVLTAILVPTFINISKKANKASDQSLRDYLNKALALVENDPELNKNGENVTMHYAIEDLEAYGILLDRITTKSDEKLVWKQADNRFYFESDISTDAERLGCWRIQNSVQEGQKFSVYAGEGYTGTSATVVSVGFDAGYKTNITKVNYTNDIPGRKVVIRTNSAATTLTIDDASTGTIYHYGSSGALNIIQCHTASYHENGKVGFAEIAKGRIVLESGADVEEIHINKKTDSSFDTVIIANNGGEEELPDRITRDAVTVTDETLVVTVESNGSSENVYVYASGETGSTQKVTEGENKQNETVNSALGQLVLDNGSAGEKAQTAEEKAEAKDAAASEAVSANFENQEGNENYVTRIGQTGYMSLQAAVEAAVNGNTIHLLKNVSLTSADYLLINKDITLDLSDKSITGAHDPMIVIGASVGKYNPTSSQLTHTGHLTIKGEGSITSSNWDMICIFPDAVLDVYGGNYTGFKAAFYIYGGTLNTYAGNFTATSPNNTYIVQVKGAGIANIYAGNFTTPVNGGYGVYLDNASESNFGSENGEGPTFNTWRPCIASNGSESHAVLANIYSGTYHSYRSDNATGENSVIQLANATTETQTLNVYGGTFEQTGLNENRCIFNIRYSGTISVNISGGNYVATSASRLFNGVGSTNSGWPTNDNVHVTVTNNAITETQNVKVYNTSDVYQSERDFNITIE